MQLTDHLRKMLMIVLIIGTGVVFYERPTSNEQLINEEDSHEEDLHEETAVPDTVQIEDTTVFAYICGEVNQPQVVELPMGARIYEAVLAAGGMTEHANANAVNLAEVLQDGSRIYIPSVDEVSEGALDVTGTDSTDSRINLNEASEEELKTLPGIGEIKAKAIIAYRETVGAFHTIEDVQKVDGIKASLFEQIRTLIKVN